MYIEKRRKIVDNISILYLILGALIFVVIILAIAYLVIRSKEKRNAEITEKISVFSIRLSAICFILPSILFAFALAVSDTTMPESEHITTDGKNIVGITIASNTPN